MFWHLNSNTTSFFVGLTPLSQCQLFFDFVVSSMHSCQLTTPYLSVGGVTIVHIRLVIGEVHRLVSFADTLLLQLAVAPVMHFTTPG